MVHLPFRNLGIWDVLCLPSEPECGEEAYCRGRYLFGNRTGHYRCGAFLYLRCSKFTNGFLADRSNINRFMSIRAACDCIGKSFPRFCALLYSFCHSLGISGWFQSMGAASCVVGLSRWFTDKERGSFYGFWSASHNIGEAMTFIIVASVVSAFGWRYGFLGAGLVGLIGVLVIWRFFHDSRRVKVFRLSTSPGRKKQ